MATLAEQLSSVQDAISAIETTGQAIACNGRSYTRADLRVLYNREERLSNKIAKETNRGRTVAEF